MGIYEKALEIQTQVNQIKTNLNIDPSTPLSEVAVATSGGGAKFAPPYVCFRGANVDISETVKQIDTSNITYMAQMFAFINSSSLSLNLDLTSWDTSKVETFNYFCSGAPAIKSINLDGLDFTTASSKDVSSSSAFSGMFESCTGLTELDFSKVVGFKPKALSGFLSGCKKLKRVIATGIDTSILYDVRTLWKNCTALEYLDISTWTFDAISSSFAGAYWTSIPAACEIIVKDDAAKTYVTSQNSAFTNVKTLAEVESA